MRGVARSAGGSETSAGAPSEYERKTHSITVSPEPPVCQITHEAVPLGVDAPAVPRSVLLERTLRGTRESARDGSVDHAAGHGAALGEREALNGPVAEAPGA
jgi:hypothetical protein